MCHTTPLSWGLSFPSQYRDCSTCFKRVVKIKELIYVKWSDQ